MLWAIFFYLVILLFAKRLLNQLDNEFRLKMRGNPLQTKIKSYFLLSLFYFWIEFCEINNII